MSRQETMLDAVNGGSPPQIHIRNTDYSFICFEPMIQSTSESIGTSDRLSIVLEHENQQRKENTVKYILLTNCNVVLRCVCVYKDLKQIILFRDNPL